MNLSLALTQWSDHYQGFRSVTDFIDTSMFQVTDTMIEHIPVSFYTPDGLPAQGNPGIAIYHSGGWVHDSPGKKFKRNQHAS